MNVSLRGLTWATRFFCIVALAFAVTCAYSATLVRVELGEPVVAFAGEEAILTLPIAIDNKGYYTLADLSVTAVISDFYSDQISKSSTFAGQVRPQENITIFHNTSLSSDEIVTQSSYLVDDLDLILQGQVNLNYASLIPFGFKVNKTVPWGAPLFNFTVGAPERFFYNTTHQMINVPVGFENHSPYFSVSGAICVEILNNRNESVKRDNVSIDVPPGTVYNGRVETLVAASSVTEAGRIFVSVETAMFNYGPEVTSYG